jgi:hypothetical protein
MRDEDLDDPADGIHLIHESLIALLEARFPVRLPTPGSTERDDVYAAGQRDVVRYLIDTREYQQEQARARGSGN